MIVQRAVDEEKLIRLTITSDEDNEDPRKSWDHLAKMMCAHSRYVLGDIQIKHHTDSHPFTLIAQEEMIDVVCDCGDKVEEEYGEWIHLEECDFEPHTARFSGEFTYHCTTHDVFVSDDEQPESCGKTHKVSEVHLSEPVELRPLYLYDHSGISMSMDSAPFSAVDSAGWDWGCVGFIYMKHSVVRENWPDIEDEDIPEKAAEVMRAEVEEYDMYLRGEIYGFYMEKGTPCDQGDIHWEPTEDSCGGFYGSNFKDSGMKDHIPEEYHYLLEELEYVS